MQEENTLAWTPQFYICEHCGQAMVVLSQAMAEEPIVCCGAKAQRLSVHGAASPGDEEHLPRVTFTGAVQLADIETSVVKVSIGMDNLTTGVGQKGGEKPPVRFLNRVKYEKGHPMEEGHLIKWVYLKARQGGQFHYFKAGEKPQVNFGLTGQDAYGYCIRETCLMNNGCKFKCRKGFEVYAYCNLHGLWKVAP